MRKIEFRVFNEITGKMSDVKTMCGRYVWDYAIDPVHDSPQRMIDTAYDVEDKSHLMQFTGLYDKNKKPIYEGDIVVCEDMHDGNINDGAWTKERDKEGITIPKKFSIGFENARFTMPNDLRWEPRNWVVIGNIYENPELLKPRPASGTKGGEGLTDVEKGG